MPTVRIRPLARIDIVEIWEYLAENSEVQADAFVDRLDGQFALLAIRVLHGARDREAQFRPGTDND